MSFIIIIDKESNMFPINRTLLESQSKTATSKTDLVKDAEPVFNELKLSFVNYFDIVSDWAVYNSCHWSLNVDRWKSNLSHINTTTYFRGDILFVDFGAQNFGHEPSYNHACIVLKNKYDTILVVPCSTKQYGTGHSGIIDATPIDGFLKNTGVQSESIRWISKNRVISNTHKQASATLLEKIDKVLLNSTPSIKAELFNKDSQIQTLKQQVESLQKQIDSMKACDDEPNK